MQHFMAAASKSDTLSITLDNQLIGVNVQEINTIQQLL